MFAGYIGPEQNFSRWADSFVGHGDWLGLKTRTNSWRDTGLVFAFGRLHPREVGPPALPTRREICQQEQGGWLLSSTREPIGANHIRLCVDEKAPAIAVEVPPATPEHFCYRRWREGWAVSTDVRFLQRLGSTTVSPNAVYGLLQFGAVPPPRSVYQEIRRVPGGHRASLRPESVSSEVSVAFSMRTDSQATQGRPEKRVRTALDDILQEIPSQSVLYFSGGVDSALLATLLKQLGRTDVLLFNYAFGEDDSEGQLAREMANHFGFDLKQVNHQSHELENVLSRIGHEYSYPFWDYSTVPTNLMMHASLEAAKRSGVVLEGTGADGLFGLATKLPHWRRIYRIPILLRAMVAKTYNWFDLWEQQNGVERVVRLIRRSVQMPILPAAVLAQNPLDGIAYEVPDGSRDALIESIDQYLIGLIADLSPEEKFSMLDILHVCAGIFAAKSFDPLRHRGVSAVYPYLEPNVLRAAISLDWEQKSEEGEEKALLKNMLANHVPSEWVYRPKTGFVPPIESLLASGTAQSYVREVVLAETGPIRGFLNRDRVRKMVDAAGQEKALGGQTYYFLWGIIMLTAWLRQQP